jgi:hypothetical protein
MSAPRNQDLPGNPVAGDSLLFDWRRQRASYWRLAWPLVICFLVVAGIGVLFRPVVLPPQQPANTAEASLLLLENNRVTHQLALRRARDLSLLLIPADPPPATGTAAAMLPRFQPSFSGFEMRLLEPASTGESADNASMPRLFPPEESVLPPLAPLAPAREAPHPMRQRLELILEGADSTSSPLRAISLELPDSHPLDLDKLRIEILVDAAGRVLLALPLTSSPEDQDHLGPLAAALRKGRFEPDAQNAVRRALARFVWR